MLTGDYVINAARLRIQISDYDSSKDYVPLTKPVSGEGSGKPRFRLENQVIDGDLKIIQVRID